jgi:ATP-dependent Clp protease adaptor protein ClpS
MGGSIALAVNVSYDAVGEGSMSSTTIEAPITVPAPPARKPKRQPPYHVVLVNDDDHTVDYVIRMMKSLFGYPEERGLQIASEVDSRGRVIVLTTTLEHAEFKRDQIHAFGADPMIASCKGAMSAELEPAE